VSSGLGIDGDQGQEVTSERVRAVRLLWNSRGLHPTHEALHIKDIIISLLMLPLLGHRPSLWITHMENGP
jgi:hypothetical protein